VVGSAQSGCQITEDLLHAGKKSLSLYQHGGTHPEMVPEKIFLGKEANFYDIKEEEINDKDVGVDSARLGTGSGRDSMSLQSLSKKALLF
jgi:cation diffusion facilitator CzcD-associated flavoprotein CzcO